jgi:hypothetical protein
VVCGVIVGAVTAPFVHVACTTAGFTGVAVAHEMLLKVTVYVAVVESTNVHPGADTGHRLPAANFAVTVTICPDA